MKSCILNFSWLTCKLCLILCFVFGVPELKHIDILLMQEAHTMTKHKQERVKDEEMQPFWIYIYISFNSFHYSFSNSLFSTLLTWEMFKTWINCIQIWIIMYNFEAGLLLLLSQHSLSRVFKLLPGFELS